MVSTFAKEAILLLLASIGLALIGGYFFIPILQRIKLGQYVRDDGPQSHLKKAGTPTMGGVIFLLPFLVLGVLFAAGNPLIWLTAACALIGFADDFIKVVLKRSLGLRAYQKLIAQGLVILAYILYQYFMGYLSTQIILPFFGNHWDMGLLWYPFVIFVVFGTTNGANLTDGLDGLSASVTTIMMVLLATIAFLQGNLQIGLLALVLLGGLIGFLWFNTYPAKVFMGDTGSLALGGFVAFAALQLRIPLFILLFAVIYLIESLSVILQVAYFKKTGKRIFKMTPIHHHFELSGYKESKIVTFFVVVTIVGSLLSLIAFL